MKKNVLSLITNLLIVICLGIAIFSSYQIFSYEIGVRKSKKENNHVSSIIDDTAPTDSTGASDAVGTTANAMKALNGIAKIMTTQQYYFGQGFAGENNIMAHYENYPSENYLYNMYASGWSPIHNQEFLSRTNSIYDAYAWYYYYTIIVNANTIIANIDNAIGTETDKDFIKNIRQAYFFK